MEGSKAIKTVLHYTGSVYLPFTETWIYGQIKNFKKYRPVIYCCDTKNLDIYPIERIRSIEEKRGLRNPQVFLNKAWNRLFNFYPFFALNLVKDRPCLVHAHFGNVGYSFLKTKKIFRLPMVTTFYGHDLSALPHREKKWRERYKKLFVEGERFLVEGHYMKKCLIGLGCPEEKITVQHLGIDLDNIEFIPRKPGKGGEICVLICGRFQEKKGIPHAIEAFGRVKEKYKNMVLTIIGDSNGMPEEERERKKIMAVIVKYHLNNCVKLMGYQPYPVVLEEVNKNHIFISPSIRASDGSTEGGVPVSIIEASASGMPILSTKHCDIPEVITDGENGYLVSEGDVKFLSERLDFLVSNPEIWERLGQKGREHIQRNYNVTTQVQKLENIYDEVIKNI